MTERTPPERAYMTTAERQMLDTIEQLRARIAELDDWAKTRAELSSEQCAAMLRRGYSLGHPDYRRMLGQNQAYMAMRSYIHGSLRQHLIEKGV